MAHGVTRDDVFEAAWSVLRDGRYPSVQSVRNLLGTGSTTTVNKYLQEFWSSLGDLHEAPALEGIPEGLATAFRELWGQAKAEAVSRLDADRRQARQEVEDAQHVAATLRDQYRELEHRCDELSEYAQKVQTQLSAEQSDHAATRDKLDDTDRLLAQARQQTNAADEAKALVERYAREQQQQLNSQIERLHAQNKEREVAHSAEVEQIEARAEEQQNHWLKEIDTVRQESRHAAEQQDQRRRAAEKLAEERAQDVADQRREALRQDSEWRNLVTSLRDETAETVRVQREEIDSARADAEQVKEANVELRERVASLEQANDDSKAGLKHEKELTNELRAHVAHLERLASTQTPSGGEQN